MPRTSQPPFEDDFARALLRSAERDEPSPAAYAKAAATLGVGVGLALSSSLPAPAVLAAGAVELSSAVRWSSSLAARLAAFGVSGALLIGAVFFVLPGRSVGGLSAPGANGSAAPALPAPAVAKAPQLASPIEGAALESGARQAQAGSEPRVGSPQGAASISGRAAGVRRRARTNMAQRQPSGASLAEQVQSLDRARVALSAGGPGAALREIAHYRAVWPKGVFLTEASVLEIEALAARGEQALAATRAAAFVAAHPDSPQAERLRSLIPPEQR